MSQTSRYKSVQAENFAKNNTVADQWEVCEITGFQEGRPVYNIQYNLYYIIYNILYIIYNIEDIVHYI